MLTGPIAPAPAARRRRTKQRVAPLEWTADTARTEPGRTFGVPFRFWGRFFVVSELTKGIHGRAGDSDIRSFFFFLLASS